MIDITTLFKEDIGRWVVYKPSFGDPEKGRIKSWNDKFIFVVYKCDSQWDRFQDFTGCATNPEDLKFIELKEKLKAGRMLFEVENVEKITLIY